MANRRSIEEKLDELDALPALGDRPLLCRGVEAALGDRQYRLVAKAATMAGEELLYELIPALLAAYRRFLEQALKRDPNCFAKKAIARALVELDCDDVAFFLEGVRYRQLEPVWGGSMDSAIDIRCSCAMGLVASGHSRALVELTELLHDPEAQARAGAVRAIARGNPREAELLLRSKVLHGDPEPAVIGECFTGLLAVEPDEAPGFVARFLSSMDDEVQELAALALGESRLDSALGHIQEAWESVPGPELRHALIHAAALHRSDAAVDWLVAEFRTAGARTAEEMVRILANYKYNATLTRRMGEALDRRDNRALSELFSKLWK